MTDQNQEIDLADVNSSLVPNDKDKKDEKKEFYSAIHLRNSDMFYANAQRLNAFKSWYPTVKTSNPSILNQIEKNEGVVVIGNHGYGKNTSKIPQLFMAYFPLRMHYWAIASSLEWKKVFPWINQVLLQEDLHVPCCLSHILTCFFAPVTIGLAEGSTAIPVYKKGRHSNWDNQKREELFERSVELLNKGRNIIIFPEQPEGEQLSYYIKDFQKGFVRVGEEYYKTTGKELRFLPVAYHHEKTFEIGDFVTFNSKEFEKDNEGERKRIIDNLKKQLIKLTEKDSEFVRRSLKMEKGDFKSLQDKIKSEDKKKGKGKGKGKKKKGKK